MARIALATAQGAQAWACPACGAQNTVQAAALGMPASALEKVAHRPPPRQVFSESFRPPRGPSERPR